MKLLKPHALKARSKVGLVAPSFRPYKPSYVSRAAALVEEMGFVPVVGKNVLSVEGHLAGSDEERASDINEFIHDSSIAAIFCITGGFGALPLLPLIDLQALVDARKIWLGSDDNCAISAAVMKLHNYVSFHGPNLQELKTKESFASLLKAVTSHGSHATIHATTDSVSQNIAQNNFTPVSGHAKGALIGGNLTTISSLFGTEYEPDLAGKVLFLCDQDERNDILDRWFTTLYVSGQLSKANAVVLGLFENCGSKTSFNLLSLEDTFGDRLKELGKPCRFDFPIAGGTSSGTVPIGVEVFFDAGKGTIEFGESALD